MSEDINAQKNKETIARLWSNLKRKGDGKFYCPCKICKGLKTQRYLIKIAEQHCRQHGHIEGGNKYHPLVCILIIYKMHKTQFDDDIRVMVNIRSSFSYRSTSLSVMLWTMTIQRMRISK